MNVPTAKILVLAISALAVSLAFILGPCQPESDGAIQPSPSEAKGRAVPEILALRIAAKNKVADDVIAGRLYLVQAAALFGALNRLPPQPVKTPLSDLGTVHLRFPANTDEERLCQQVLH